MSTTFGIKIYEHYEEDDDYLVIATSGRYGISWTSLLHLHLRDDVEIVALDNDTDYKTVADLRKAIDGS